MNYNEALKVISPLAALKSLKIEGKEEGAFIYFPCPECNEDAIIRAYGEKKNFWLCPRCKVCGHIITLAMNLQALEYEEAKQFLLRKAFSPLDNIDEEVNLNYELEWCEFMHYENLDREICEKLGIGKPKGKNCMPGHLAFTVLNENRKKVGYVGIKIANGNPYIPKLFHPEFYLYNLCYIDPDEEVVLTPDMLDCVRLISQRIQAISNFWLPYLSIKQLELLQPITHLSIKGFGENTSEIAVKLARFRGSYYRFI